MSLLLSKTEKQTVYPIKTFYDIRNNNNLKPLAIKRWKLLAT